MQKNPLIDLQEHFERYSNVLPVSGFNNAKDDIDLMKASLLPILVNERDIEPTVMKKANQFFLFKFRDIQVLDIMNFHGGATSLDFSSRLTKPKRQKVFSLRMVRLSREIEQQRTSTLWLLPEHSAQ